MESVKEGAIEAPVYRGDFGILRFRGRFNANTIYDQLGHDNGLLKTVFGYVRDISYKGKRFAFSVEGAHFDTNGLSIFTYSVRMSPDGQKMAVIGANEHLKKLLHITKLEQFFDFYKTEEEL